MPAVKDGWIVGDTFVYNTFSVFQASRMEASIDRKKPPYLHEYYNVQFFCQAPFGNIRSTEGRIINSLIEALNGKTKLPKYILISVDTDVIQGVVDRICDFGFKSVYYQAIDYLTKEINKLLTLRKEDLRSKRTGALSNSIEPKIIWIQAIKRPFTAHQSRKETFKLVGKANDVLEEVVQKYNKTSHILYLDTVNEITHIDGMGNLTAAGKTVFWKELDSTMRRFDKGETELQIRIKQDYIARNERRRDRYDEKYRHNERW